MNQILKNMIYNEKSRRWINIIFIIIVLLSGSKVLTCIAFLFWIIFLVYLIKSCESKIIIISYFLQIAFAAIIIVFSFYYGLLGK